MAVTVIIPSDIKNSGQNEPMIVQNMKLTLSPLTWKIWWVPDNASKWQMGFNWAFKGL